MSGYPPPPSYNEVVNAPQGQTYPAYGAQPNVAPYPVYGATPGCPYPTQPPVGEPVNPNYPHNPYAQQQAQYGSPEHDQSQPKYDDETAAVFAGSSFSNKAIRQAFIKKVYLILTAQLLVTCAFICLFQFVQPLRFWVLHNSWFYYLSYAVFLCTYIALVCCPGVRRRYPGNFVALSIFTLALSYMTGTIASFYTTPGVLSAAGITAAVCLAVSIFAIQTRIDFTRCTALLFIGSFVVIFMGIACIIVWRVQGPNYVLHVVYGGLAALLFGMFLAYDTQMLIGGRKYELSPEEYIFGALQLYLDIVNLFLIILGLFGNKN